MPNAHHHRSPIFLFAFGSRRTPPCVPSGGAFRRNRSRRFKGGTEKLYSTGEKTGQGVEGNFGELIFCNHGTSCHSLIGVPAFLRQQVGLAKIGYKYNWFCAEVKLEVKGKTEENEKQVIKKVDALCRRYFLYRLASTVRFRSVCFDFVLHEVQEREFLRKPISLKLCSGKSVLCSTRSDGEKV